MASLFSDGERDRVALVLGYYPGQIETDVVGVWLENIDTEFRKQKVLEIAEELDSIDEEIKKLRTRLLVSQVDEIVLNARQAISTYKSEGSRLLRQLSNLTNIPVYFDRFSHASAVTKRQFVP